MLDPVSLGLMAGGLATSFIGGAGSARAAKNAANAQRAAAEQWQKFVAQREAQANDILAGSVTPAQLSAYDKTLSAQEKTVQRQESLAANLHPALINAGEQLNKAIQGQSAPIMQNLTNQRQLQRQQLLDRIRQTQGSGAESSTAGQQALNQFDSETSNILSGAQQNYIQQLSGLSLGGMSQTAEASNQANTVGANIVNSSPMTKVAQQQAQNLLGFTQAQAPAFEARTQAAGGDALGSQLMSQNFANLGSGILQAGAAMYGANRSQKPTTQATTVADNIAQPAALSSGGNSVSSGVYGSDNAGINFNGMPRNRFGYGGY